MVCAWCGGCKPHFIPNLVVWFSCWECLGNCLTSGARHSLGGSLKITTFYLRRQEEIQKCIFKQCFAFICINLKIKSHEDGIQTIWNCVQENSWDANIWKDKWQVHLFLLNIHEVMTNCAFVGQLSRVYSGLRKSGFGVRLMLLFCFLFSASGDGIIPKLKHIDCVNGR